MSTYRTVVLDPPWEYERASGLGSTRAALDHYPTMTNAAIAALPVGDLADASAHVYLWTTNPRMFAEPRDGIGPVEMLRAWGFRYITLLTWHKLGAPGMGWYFRGDTEHVLFGVRGKAPIPPESRLSNHFAAPRTVHSAKPDRFHEAMFDLRGVDGRPASVTRLAAIIETLRKAGWDIETRAPHGEQATYVLRSRPGFGRPVGAARECPSCHLTHHVGTACAVPAQTSLGLALSAGSGGHPGPSLPRAQRDAVPDVPGPSGP